jgi:hypothetical protein
MHAISISASLVLSTQGTEELVVRVLDIKQHLSVSLAPNVNPERDLPVVIALL